MARWPAGGCGWWVVGCGGLVMADGALMGISKGGEELHANR